MQVYTKHHIILPIQCNGKAKEKHEYVESQMAVI